jgi:hypothetical protein
MKKILVFLIALGLTSAASAAEPTPAYLQPSVLKAAVDIHLTEEQKPMFREALSKFFNDRMSAINLLLRRRNQTGLPRKIRSKTNSLLRTMDKDMAEFLMEEQMPAYEIYRQTLKSNLQGM